MSLIQQITAMSIATQRIIITAPTVAAIFVPEKPLVDSIIYSDKILKIYTYRHYMRIFNVIMDHIILIKNGMTYN